MPRARGVLSKVSMSSMAGWVLVDGTMDPRLVPIVDNCVMTI